MSLAGSGSASKQSVKEHLTSIKGIVDKYLDDGKKQRDGTGEVSQDGWVDKEWEDDTLEERLERIHSEMTPMMLLSTNVNSTADQPVFSKKAQSAEVHSEQDKGKGGKGLQASWLQDGPLIKDTEQFSDLVVMTSLANNDSPFWNASIFDPGSETRTIDQLDTSDDTTLKGALSSVLTRVIEEWQTQRTEIETIITQESQEATSLREVTSIEESVDLLHHLKPRIEALWWGQEVSQRLNPANRTIGQDC